MPPTLYCPNEARRALVREHPALNGIDFLEVLDAAVAADGLRQQTLLVHCFRPIAGLGRRNVRVEGGVRVTPVGVLWARRADTVPGGLLTPSEQAYLGALSSPDAVLAVRTDAVGDYSTYTLVLRLSAAQPDEPPDGFDRILSRVDFSFKVECESDFDCAPATLCPEPSLPAPHIDYLARDYASFRTVMLDRLAALAPEWTERSPADIGMAIVEAVAFVGDQLSYYQDAVATEAYLGTARRRLSVRRHARLVGYPMHDGCNARAWVSFAVTAGSSADGALLPTGTLVLDRDADAGVAVAPDPPQALERALARNPACFETLHPLRLRAARGQVPLYAWGDPRCCLSAGATEATLLGDAAELDLHAGDVIVLVEARGPESGREEDADPSHRHAVRLCAEPVGRLDPVSGSPVTQVRWFTSDALPFPLCLWELPAADGGVLRTAVALCNVALADHGRTFVDEPLEPRRVPDEGPYRPRLPRAGVTRAAPYAHTEARAKAAIAAMRSGAGDALPVVTLTGDDERWTAVRELLGSDRFATGFVVEVDNDEEALLRFGDDVLGRRPSPGAVLAATYRVGGGRAGNVGADTLACVVTALAGLESVRNPLPAAGGADPEPVEQVRLLAPEAFRTQERAVTEADYAAIAERHPEVQRAAATRRWTGSWHTVFVTVDRAGGRPVDPGFRAEMRGFLERYRLAGHDVEVDAPRFVPLDIVLTACVAPGHFRSAVRRALLERFSSSVLPGGARGFFHPDELTFGQPVYLSRVVAAAMRVPGVRWVDTDDTPPRPTRFQRWGRLAAGEVAAGRIEIGRLEIARVDTDPSTPENGRIEFVMEGGL